MGTVEQVVLGGVGEPAPGRLVRVAGGAQTPGCLVLLQDPHGAGTEVAVRTQVQSPLDVLHGRALVAVPEQRPAGDAPVPTRNGGGGGRGRRGRCRGRGEADRSATAHCEADGQNGGGGPGGRWLGGLAVLREGPAGGPGGTDVVLADGARMRRPSGSDGHGCLPTPVKLAVGFGLGFIARSAPADFTPGFRPLTVETQLPGSPTPAIVFEGSRWALAGLGVDPSAVRRLYRTADDCITDGSRRKPSDPQRPSGKALEGCLTDQGARVDMRCPERV